MERRTFLKTLALTTTGLLANPIKTINSFHKIGVTQTVKQKFAINAMRTKEKIAADIFNNAFSTRWDE